MEGLGMWVVAGAVSAAGLAVLGVGGGLWWFVRRRRARAQQRDGRLVSEVLGTLADELDESREDKHPAVAPWVRAQLAGAAVEGDGLAGVQVQVHVARASATHFSLALEVRTGDRIRTATHGESVPWHGLPASYRQTLLRDGGEAATFVLVEASS